MFAGIRDPVLAVCCAECYKVYIRYSIHHIVYNRYSIHHIVYYTSYKVYIMGI